MKIDLIKALHFIKIIIHYIYNPFSFLEVVKLRETKALFFSLIPGIAKQLIKQRFQNFLIKEKTSFT